MNIVDDNLKYTLATSERRTLSIYIERDGSILIRAPRSIQKKELDAIIKLKSYWIYKSIAEIQELNRTRVSRQIANGEGFLYMGKSYRLRLEKNLEVPLKLNQGYFMLQEDEVDNARRHFVNYYKERGKEHISKRVDYFKPKLGVDPKTVRIMELKNRWASRSEKGLNFHWKVMLAPVTVIDYVIVHELAHYLRSDHGARFWDEVESVMPNFREKKDWLRRNGANLDI